MGPRGWVHKVSGMVDIFVVVSVAIKADVPFPPVRDDDGSWSNMLLDDADKGMVIPVVVLTLNQKAVVASAFHSTK